jgi:threonine/homoserine/homoserine lactone efflux protein
MKTLWKHRQTITAIVFWMLFLGSFAFSHHYPGLDTVWVSGAYLFLFAVAVFSLIQTFRDHKEKGQFSYRGVPRWLTRFLGGDKNNHQ